MSSRSINSAASSELNMDICHCSVYHHEMLLSNPLLRPCGLASRYQALRVAARWGRSGGTLDAFIGHICYCPASLCMVLQARD